MPGFHGVPRNRNSVLAAIAPIGISHGGKGPKMRGDGKIYQRGDVWWADYTLRGRRYRKSTGKDNQRDANDWLRKQLVDAKEGKAIPSDKVTVSELVRELFRQYDVDGRKTKEDDERRWRLHLEPFFGASRAMD